jgi:hypothetical protein
MIEIGIITAGNSGTFRVIRRNIFDLDGLDVFQIDKMISR